MILQSLSILFQNQIIQMYNFEDLRRKNHFGQGLKNGLGSNSHNNIGANFDKKTSDYSNDKERNKKAQMPQANDLNQMKESATINFRQLQNKQNIQNTHKINKNVAQLKMNKKPSIQQPSGLQIHVNIQNVISQKRITLNEAHSERELSQRTKQEEKNQLKAKKPTKVMTVSNDAQNFECNEQLEVKIQKKTEKKMIVPKLQKNNSQMNSNYSMNNHFIHPPSQIPHMQTANIQNHLRPKFLQKNVPPKEMVQFDGKEKQINNLSQGLTVCYLDSRQIHYGVDPLYIQKKQKNFQWLMRASLMEWMMHVSYEFMLKRQTLHIAMTLVDNFFQATTNLTKSDFQLSGAASLFIAAKLQEFQPLSSKQFAKSTSNRFTADQIRQMQIRICKTLKFSLNPPTINMWANKIMQQWDLFIDNQTSSSSLDYFTANSPLYFKKLDDQSYKNYRQIMQILDCSMLDIQTVQYKPKILVCSLLYLFLGKQFKEFTKKRIITELPRTSRFFLEETPFNDFFRQFLQQSFGIKMFELLPSVQYLATYFILHLNFDRPCLPNEQEDIQRMNLQQYSSFQTYNPHMLGTVKKRFRGIYQ